MQNLESIRSSQLFDPRLLRFNDLEASFYYDFNPTMRKSWMSVKLELVTIHGGLCV